MSLLSSLWKLIALTYSYLRVDCQGLTQWISMGSRVWQIYKRIRMPMCPVNLYLHNDWLQASHLVLMGQFADGLRCPCLRHERCPQDRWSHLHTNGLSAHARTVGGCLTLIYLCCTTRTTRARTSTEWSREQLAHGHLLTRNFHSQFTITKSQAIINNGVQDCLYFTLNAR